MFKLIFQYGTGKVKMEKLLNWKGSNELQKIPDYLNLATATFAFLF